MLPTTQAAQNQLEGAQILRSLYLSGAVYGAPGPFCAPTATWLSALAKAAASTSSADKATAVNSTARISLNRYCCRKSYRDGSGGQGPRVAFTGGRVQTTRIHTMCRLCVGVPTARSPYISAAMSPCADMEVTNIHHDSLPLLCVLREPWCARPGC
jgi:hypothetical protein